MKASVAFVLCTALARVGSPQDAAFDRLHLMAPAAPGGGWDQTARALQAALRAEGLARVVEVENVPGAAGTIGLAKFVSTSPPDEAALMVTGLVMVSGIVMNNSPVSLAQATPIARLTGEYEVVVVPRGSPYRTLSDLLAALRADPGAISWAGGSAGGTDQILVGLIAQAARVDPGRTNYVAFAGGGESLAAILGGQVSAGVSGLSEYAPHIASGSLTALAISSPDRQDGVDIKTLREQGVGVALANWRGVVAPPGLSAPARDRLLRLMGRLARSEAWRSTLKRNGWIDLYMPGDAFAQFLRAEQRRVTAMVRELGGAPAGRGAMVFPAIVGVGLMVLGGALGARALRKGPTAKRDPGNARALALVAAGALANVFLMETAGFVLASSVLFWLVARGFGSRRGVRDAVLAVAFSTGAYLLFTRGLTLSLPAGKLF